MQGVFTFTKVTECEVLWCEFRTPMMMKIGLPMQQGLVLYDKQVYRVEHAVTHESDSGVSKPGKGMRPILKKDISEDKFLNYHRQRVKYQG